MPTPSSSLVVFHQGAIGDFILSLSVVQAVARVLAPQSVIAVASAPSARLAAGRSLVRAARSPEDLGLHTLFDPLTEPDPRIRSLVAAATVLSWLGDAAHVTHAQLKRAGAARVVSVDPRVTKETLQTRRHITAQWADAVRQQGVAIPDPCAVSIAMNASPRSGILIHPGSGGRAKCWPIERFIALADGLSMQVSWMIGPAELEVEPERFAPLLRRLQSTGETLIQEQDLSRAAEGISEFALYIGNDAGTTHLAAALGVPTTAIFGPADPCVWRPLGEHVRVAAPAQPAERGFPSVDDVLSAVRALNL